MNRREQARFIRGNAKVIASAMVARVRAGDTPDEWDGIELRWWPRQRFEENTLRYPQRGDRSMARRFRDFKNEYLVRNL